MTYDTLIVGSHIITPNGMIDKNIILDEGKIVKLTNETPSCDHTSLLFGSGTISPSQNENRLRVKSGVENVKV